MKHLKYKENINKGFKVFMRTCHKCNKVYHTPSRCSRVCEKCSKTERPRPKDILYTFDANDWLVEVNNESNKKL